ALCQNGKVLIPSGIKALSGSCVLIPCRFTLESKYESSLTRPCKGTWNRVIVKPVLMAPTRDDLLEKNCTTILNLPYPYPRSYLSQSFFNLECDKSLPFKFPESINIDVKDNSQFYCEASNYLGLQKSTVIQLAQNSYGKEMANIFVYLHHCPSTPT
ncbi:unnamed protein product, partial [Coregonus sp. 'balchen']